MKSTIRASVFSLIAMLLGACAGGVPFTEMQPERTAVDPEMGRIFMYRVTTLGAAIKPKIHINDEIIGVSEAKGFMFVDRPAGEYIVKTSTEVKRQLSFVLEPGQTRYVRFKVSMGFLVGHVYPELVEEEVGSAEIQKCNYNGPVADTT
jgi:hypothetical protein